MKIFCDFDGTAAVNDVGRTLFETFGDPKCVDVVRSWKAGQISSKDCLIEECRLTRVTRQQLLEYADQQELDPSFESFILFCKAHDAEVEILSDGLDVYIERILRNHGLDTLVEFHANHLEFINHHEVRAGFPYSDKGCGECANCKGYHVREARQTQDQIIYVGDGLSDRCGANEADLVFAKRDLLQYCREQNIRHFEFQDFRDVQRKLGKLL